jgi:hypothetical protein
VPKFRKKPVVIEAIRYKKGMKHLAVCDKADAPGIACPHIHTLKGNHMLTTGDWIIKGVKGEFYPCKPDIFAATYEPVEG